MAKKKTRKIEVYKEVASIEIDKYDGTTIEQFVNRIKRNIPAGIDEKDIELTFEVEEEPYYYDEIITHIKLKLIVKEIKEVEVK